MRTVLSVPLLACVLVFGSGCTATTVADVDALVREMGRPVSFDLVFSDAQEIPRFKGEFETTAEFEDRQALALAKCQQRYLIDVPVDHEYVRYDADRQVLIVATYGLTNTAASLDELSAIFGYGSELSGAGAEISYSSLGAGNILWALPREKRNVGTYGGSNAFGATVTITKQESVARGVFDRKGEYEENVWAESRASYVKGDSPVAFEIKADPHRARAIKQGGLRAAILVALKSPFYATGVDRFTPTIRAPYDRTTEVRYLIGDIQSAVIYDGDGEVLASRGTR